MQVTREEFSMLQQLRHNIHCGIFNPVNITSFMDGIHMSSTSIARKFPFLFQYTPVEYYTMIKMEYARAMLSGGKSVKEVSAMLGYGNWKLFARTFKRKMKCPPSTFRRREVAVKLEKIGTLKFLLV